MKTPDILFYSGNGNHALGAKIMSQLREYLNDKDIDFDHIEFGKFPDEESDARIKKFSGVKDKTIVLYQSIFNRYLFEETLQLSWAFKRQYQAKRLILVAPFMIFRRQDHDEINSEICRLKMTIDRLKHAGVDEIVTVTPHSHKMEEFCKEFGINFHEADPSTIFSETVKAYVSEEPLVYSPDQGSISRAINLAKANNWPVIFSLKKRGLNNEIQIMEEEKQEIEKIIQSYQYPIFYASNSKIKGKTIIMIEDEVSTGGTANRTGVKLKENGAGIIIFISTHSILTPGWRRKLFDQNPFDRVIMGDTIPRDYEKRTGGLIHDISMSDILARKLYVIIKATKN